MFGQFILRSMDTFSGLERELNLHKHHYYFIHSADQSNNIGTEQEEVKIAGRKIEQRKYTKNTKPDMNKNNDI